MPEIHTFAKNYGLIVWRFPHLVLIYPKNKCEYERFIRKFSTLQFIDMPVH